MIAEFTTAFIVVVAVLWLLLVAAILLETRATTRRAETHLAALRRLQHVAEPGQF